MHGRTGAQTKYNVEVYGLRKDKIQLLQKANTALLLNDLQSRLMGPFRQTLKTADPSGVSINLIILRRINASIRETKNAQIPKHTQWRSLVGRRARAGPGPPCCGGAALSVRLREFKNREARAQGQYGRDDRRVYSCCTLLPGNRLICGLSRRDALKIVIIHRVTGS